MSVKVEVKRRYQLMTTIIKLSGRLDGGSVVQLKALMNTYNLQGSVILNLAGVTFLDSMGISLLVSLYKQCKELGHRFLISEIQEQPFKVLQLCQLDSVFTIFSSTEKALQQVSDGK